MLEQAIRYMLRSYFIEDIQYFLENIWEPLISNRISDEQSIKVSNNNKKIIDMISDLPFLELNKFEGKVSFIEYTTLHLPGENFATVVQALKQIANQQMTAKELGKFFSSSSNSESWERRGAQIYHDLHLFSLVTDTKELTTYGEKYLSIGDKSWIRKGLMREPVVKLYLDFLISLRGYASRKVVERFILKITRFIIRNSQGTNLIKETVAKKRTACILNWLEESELVDNELNPIIESGELLYKKEVDLSLLKEGLTIPKKYWDTFYKVNGEHLEKGMSREGRFITDDQEYIILFRNNNLSDKYKSREMVQIRYNNKDLQEELIKRFSLTNNYLEEYKIKNVNKRVMIPEEMKEYLYIYSTNVPYHYRIEFITVDKKRQYSRVIKEIQKKEDIEKICEMSDKEFKNYLDDNYGDDKASYETRQGITSYRKVRNTLVNDLKKRYNHQCQICMHSFKDSYGVNYSEGHHIKPFAKFEDHTPENIVILCPNHHRIIHKAKPYFDREKLAFVYDNGYVEYLQLKGHLKPQKIKNPA